MKIELSRLEKIDARIKEILEEWGLDVVPVDFDIVPAQRMFEIMAYGLPVNFRHWSRGRDYERLRTIYEHSGAGLPYEMVLNTSPPKAFLMETNPFPIQVLVMAHVYAHVDFFNSNQSFEDVSKEMPVQAYEATKRFDAYEQHNGLSRLEPLCDAGLALQFNVDPDWHKKRETREEQIQRLYGDQPQEEQRDLDFFRLYPREKAKHPDYKELVHTTPLEPERDVLGYITANSPKPLQDWEQDVLSVIRSQGLYLYPQIRTKICNEGWAAYWHERIMHRLFQERLLTSEEHGYFAQYHSAVLAPNPFQLNPYLVGKKIFEDIKERWDKGRCGKAWQECEDLYQLEHWDTELMQGEQKIFQVRSLYSDRMLLEHFLTDKLIHDLELYIYEERLRRNRDKELVIVESRPEVIRSQLKELHADAGQPRILVQNGNYHNQAELYLKHYFQDAPLDYEYLQKTLEHIFFLWGRSVHLETVDVIQDRRGRVSKQEVVHHYDGVSHTKTDISSGSICESCMSCRP
ncbi:MAG: SpoVR family protein [Desulfohalobiaceae bacterium]